MSKIKINTARCKGCGYCVNDCPRKALSFSGNINDKGYDTVHMSERVQRSAPEVYIQRLSSTLCAPLPYHIRQEALP